MTKRCVSADSIRHCTACRRRLCDREPLPHPQAAVYAVLLPPEQHVVAAHLSIGQRGRVRVITPACGVKMLRHRTRKGRVVRCPLLIWSPVRRGLEV